jgi:hypothetical protein
MEDTKEQHPVQASVSAGMLGEDHTIAPPLEDSSHSVGGDSQTRVLVDLLGQIKPLCSERPEDILRFFVRLGDIHALGLVDDRTFITRVLPLVPTGLLQLLGACLRSGDNWAECKARLLEEHFPHFVRERLIRDLIVFNFHAREQPLRVYIDQVFQAADFLQYSATEQQIVERLVMNFHPDVLSQAAFLDKPRTRRELYRVVGLIEERFSVRQERARIGQGPGGGSEGGQNPTTPSSNAQNKSRGPGSGQVKCWNCGQSGHVRTNCPRGAKPPGNGQRPGSRLGPGADY